MISTMGEKKWRKVWVLSVLETAVLNRVLRVAH